MKYYKVATHCNICLVTDAFQIFKSLICGLYLFEYKKYLEKKPYDQKHSKSILKKKERNILHQKTYIFPINSFLIILRKLILKILKIVRKTVKFKLQNYKYCFPFKISKRVKICFKSLQSLVFFTKERKEKIRTKIKMTKI